MKTRLRFIRTILGISRPFGASMEVYKIGRYKMNLAETYHSLPARYPELKGQVAIVTGSSRGIGAGIAARLAREGMQVVMHGLDGAELDATVQQLKSVGASVTSVDGDLSNSTTIDRLFAAALDTLGGLDLLVNNAASLERVRSDELTLTMLDAQFDLNLRVPTVCALRAAAYMRAKRQGNIVNISSVAGLRAQLPGLPYGITKGALDAMTRVLAIDLADVGIRVNGIGPGFTPHRFDPEKEADYLRNLSKLIPMRTWGTPDDIGSMVAFLASPDARYITGQTFYVDGGLSAQLHPPEHPI